MIHLEQDPRSCSCGRVFGNRFGLASHLNAIKQSVIRNIIG